MATSAIVEAGLTLFTEAENVKQTAAPSGSTRFGLSLAGFVAQSSPGTA